MSQFRAAYRYAHAIIGVAEEFKKLDEVTRDFLFLDKLIGSSKELSSFIKSPIVNKEKKKRAFTELLTNRVSELTLKFVILLTSKGREELLPEIIRQFYGLRDQLLGILNVTTRATVSFTPAQEQQLVAQLERATKKKIRMKYVLDPSLKGGFSVQHEDTVWDASVRHQLELLRERFIEGTA
ncbi:MAG: ATP synthase F1 subunit delta [Ignavibacteriales bacterium]|nr:ATP synthase F1 subunit delta [Ignavibacteriales bacterium]